MNHFFDKRNLITSSYEISSCFSTSSSNFNRLSSKYVSFDTRICGKDFDGVAMVDNSYRNNKDCVTYGYNVDVIDIFIKKGVM